jgi:V8-like Glu-specific endopeptidase
MTIASISAPLALRKPMPARRATLSLAFSILGYGCIAPVGDAVDLEQPGGAYPAEVTDPALVRQLLSEDWAGDEVGLPLPRAYDLGPAQVVDHDEPTNLADIWSPTANDAVADIGDELSMVVLHEGRSYRVEIEPSAELDELTAARIRFDQAAMLASLETIDSDADTGSDVAVAREPLLVGAEGRVRQGIADGLAASSWMATIGQVTLDTNFNDYRCSGTLISSRTAIMAAHCVIGANTDGTFYYRRLAFHPRADGTQASNYPWGNWRWISQANVSIPSLYTSRRCYTAYDQTCQASDWALVRFTRPAAAAGHNLYMGYRAFTQAQMTSLKNKGYPICSINPAPPGCLSKTLYGDAATCTVSTALGADGAYATVVAHACDTSRGHSGSPLYQYFNGTPTIAGVHITDAGVFAAIDNRNWMRHVTPTMVTQINAFR